jgi:outer membrane protein TolC
MKSALAILTFAVVALAQIPGQTPPVPTAAPSPPAALPAPSPNAPVISLADAIARARQYAGQIQDASYNVQAAHEDTRQARVNRLPTVNAFNQYIYTEGNGTPSGVYVANDGVHIYNEQAQAHEELLNVFRRAEYRRAFAAEAAARAKVDVASRGLSATVVTDYFAILAAQRHFVNVQAGLRESEDFLDITTKQEQAGEAARADVIKARIDLQQRQRDLQDAQVAVEKAKITLAVLIFPTFTTDYSAVDDLDNSALTAASLIAPLDEARAKATSTNPDVKAAEFSLSAASNDVSVARYGYLPSLAVDLFYGFNANRLTATAVRADYGGEDVRVQNYGLSGQVTLNVPLWTWGTTGSKIRQAEFKRAQAQLDLSLARRTLDANIATAYAEARAALAQLDSLRSSLDLAVESLRLTRLRYQAGEAVALEVVDAQSTVTTARNAYSDGLVRYRAAVAALDILTGSL